MAVLDHVSPNRTNLFSRIGTAIANAAISFAEARARTQDVEFYNAMSDKELAARGLRREDIVRHVFRDRAFF